MSPEQAAASSEEIIRNIEDTHIHIDAIAEKLSEHASRMRIGGKTYAQWSEEYDIRVSHDALPFEIKTALNKLIELRCIATANFAQVKNERREFLFDYERRFNTQVEAECARRGNRNGIDKIKEQVKSQLGDYTLFKRRMDQQVDFWQDKINHCNDIYRMLNTMSICNGTTARIGETY